MTTLQWSEDMGVEMAQMDATHQECVALLQAEDLPHAVMQQVTFSA